MPIDYTSVDRVFELSFRKLEKPSARLDFPPPGTLMNVLNALIETKAPTLILPHSKSQILASAGVEMWHRAIHSFLWSLVLTDASPMWASISGYYASHFVMRAFCHSLGLFKSFIKRKTIQITIVSGQFVLSEVTSNVGGEHAFYWKAIKGHPKFASNPLFRTNSERDPRSDSSHRTYANYSDHINSFVSIKVPAIHELTDNVKKISHIRRHSVIEPSREDYPDLRNVQILAFQRIIEFHDFLDERIPTNRFWRAHRRPAWCKDIMLFHVEDAGLESPLV